jgi:uncharacterized protein (UPF0335 family)
MTITNNTVQSFVSRIERLESEKAETQADIKSVYQEAKSTGLDPKILRKVIAIRKKDKADREEEEALIKVYMEALGDLRDTPLGQAAMRTVSANA